MQRKNNESVSEGTATSPRLKSSLLMLTLLSGLTASAQTSTVTTNFTDGRVIPDASASGLASTRMISTRITQMTDLNVALKVNGSFNGDLYAYLTHSSGRTVLLNRVGKRASASLGYGDDGLNVTFDDGSTNGDAHIYRFTINGGNHNPALPANTPLTGVWAPDGRTTSPLTVLDTDTRAALLNSFNGLNPNGEWVLFVADLESGDIHTLDTWGLEITGYTSPLITENPASLTKECSLENATFSVTANGSTPLSYQWRHGGSSITDATNSTLTILNATFADAGNYDVVVSSPYGAVTSSVAVLTIQDTTAPSLTCPNNITVNNAPGQCSASVAFAATASDTCGEVSKVYKIGELEITSPYTFPKGTTTVNVAATDEHNNSSTCSFTVTVNDTELPTISAPAAVVVSTDAGQCTASSVALGSPVSNDNCPGSSVANNAPAIFPKGLTVVTWTVTDASGNSATASQNVTVNDTELPTISAPAAVVVSTDAGQCSASSVALGSPVSGDNCPGSSVANNAPAIFPKGLTVVTWTVTDASGNSATANQNVTVNDTELPTISAPAAVVVSTDAGQCSASSVALGSPVSNDNCPGSSVSNNAPAIFPKGLTVVTWTVTDAAGNSATASQNVTVNDTELPTITCPANVSLFTTNASGTAVSFALPSGADNCGVQSVVAIPASGSNFPIGTTPVAVTVTDTSANTAQCTFNVTVVLNIAPVAGNDNMGAVQNHARSVKIEKCFSNDFDLDDDALTVIAVSASTNGGTVTFNSTHFTYTPATNYVGSDAFTYTISDGRGGVATATVTVEVYSQDALTPNMLPIVMNGGIPTIRFAGIPGFTYTLERTPTLSPAAWQVIGGTITVPASGIAEYPDTTAPEGSAFYRTASAELP